MVDPRWVEREFDRRAATYDSSEMHRDLARAVAAFASPSEVDRVLDVATGTGLVLRAIGGAAERLTGVDLSSEMLGVASGVLSHARWLQADAAALPLDDGSFDLVTCAAALPYLPDVAAAIGEWRRVLAAGGRIVLSAFPVDAFTGQRLLRHAAARHGLVIDDPNAPWGTSAAIAELVRPLGLTVRRSSTWTSPLPPGTADGLLGSRYPLDARDDLRTADARQLALVRGTLERLISNTPQWTVSALLVELRAFPERVTR